MGYVDKFTLSIKMCKLDLGGVNLYFATHVQLMLDDVERNGRQFVYLIN